VISILNCLLYVYCDMYFRLGLCLYDFVSNASLCVCILYVYVCVFLTYLQYAVQKNLTTVKLLKFIKL